MRDSASSRFRKTIGVTEEHFAFIESIRKKKSKAGKLEEIINNYIEALELEKSNEKSNKSEL